MHRDGDEGVGYYRLGAAAPPPPPAAPAPAAAPGSFSDFMRDMRELGAV